jgi:hypothetical protein
VTLLALALGATLHVEARAPLGGDGSAERPFSRVDEAVAHAQAGDEVRIGAGIYEGALALEREVVLVGEGPTTVLYGPPGAPVAVTARAKATLRRLAVQGGRVGVKGGQLVLDDVTVRGQPDVGVTCDGTCALSDSLFVQSFAAAVGLQVRGAARVERTEFRGGFRRAVEVQPHAVLTGAAVTIREAGTGLWIEEATAKLEDLQVDSTHGDGLEAFSSAVTLTDARFFRNEHAALFTRGSEAKLTNCAVIEPRQAGVAEVGSHLVLVDHLHVGATRDAAVTVDEGSAELTRVRIESPGPTGIRARLATLKLTEVFVRGATLEADTLGAALFAFDVKLSGEGLEAVACQGAAVEVQLGSGSLGSVLVRKGGLAAVAYEHQAWLDLPGFWALDGMGTGVACIEGGHGKLLGLRLERLAAGPNLVDCSCKLDERPGPPLPSCGPVTGKGTDP